MKDNNGRYIHSDDYLDRRRINDVPRSRNLNLDPARAYSGDARASERINRERQRKQARDNSMLRKSMASGNNPRRIKGRESKSISQVEKLKYIIAGGAVTAAMSIGIVNFPKIANATHDVVFGNEGIERVKKDYSEIISAANTGRTDDNTRPDFNYRQIADAIIESGNFDDGLYGTYKTFQDRVYNGHQYFEDGLMQGETNPEGSIHDEMDRVLQFTNFETLDNYLETRGYKDLKEFEKDMEQRIKIEEEIKRAENAKDKEIVRMQEELDEMSANHKFTDSNGGKAI